MMKKYSSTKKANFAAVFYTLVTIFMLFVVSIAVLYLQSPLEDIKNDILNDPDFSSNSKALISGQYNNYTSMWDGIIVFCLFFFWMAGLVSSFFLDSHPILFAVVFVLLLITFYVGALLANVYADIKEDSTISAYDSQYPLTNWIFENLLFVLIGMGSTFLGAIYVRFRL